MNLDFTVRHFTLTPAIKKFAREQTKKIAKLLDDRDHIRLHLTMAIEKHRNLAELVLTMGEQVLTGKATTDDMYQSITQATEKLARQVGKLKEKVETKRKTRASVKTVTAAAEDARSAADDSAADPKKPRIIQTRRYAIKPMTPDDAVTSLSPKDQFVVFRNVETDRIGVLYRRPDGNFGLIEP
ncbi:MAG: ribosome-associated translation inhibitor RaiA [Chloracidobacterium sp.]|uniref:Ribosome hibernation promoting factor n=1 Tax=Chloracidobacterium validum TaxID=2821543 RepID=A0ABX8BFW5_9BACT|nr:ribosome-associated translation inhibitor RaiA [Chloracidobacterium validum]QUW04513.1 ribosome-associated translation inhibitor RaiA [Chloracidobacterium validum]